MTKYTYEQKLKTVLRVTEDNLSISRAAQELGTAYSHVRRWVKRYEEFGTKGLLMKQGSYSGEFKQHIVEYMHENHLSIFEAATKFGIPSDRTVGKWERIYYEEGAEALYIDRRGRPNKMKKKESRKLKLDKETEEDLISEVQRLRMENAYLKKLNALVQERIKRENRKK